MASRTPTPDLEWYAAISERKHLNSPRSPFASVDRCPRYYQSLSLLGQAGATSIQPKEEARLLKKWKAHELWPRTMEQSTSIMGSSERPSIYSSFCPEVSHEAFGIFASFMSRYTDEIDSDNAYRRLGREGASTNDWRWSWSDVIPAHYSDCPLYSPLLHERSETRVDKILTWGKNNSIIAVVIVASIVIGGLAAAFTHVSTLLAPFKSEHITVVATKVTSGEMSFNGAKNEGDAVVQFAPKDSKQTSNGLLSIIRLICTRIA